MTHSTKRFTLCTQTPAVQAANARHAALANPPSRYLIFPIGLHTVFAAETFGGIYLTTVQRHLLNVVTSNGTLQRRHEVCTLLAWKQHACRCGCANSHARETGSNRSDRPAKLLLSVIRACGTAAFQAMQSLKSKTCKLN